MGVIIGRRGIAGYYYAATGGLTSFDLSGKRSLTNGEMEILLTLDAGVDTDPGTEVTSNLFEK